jgi:hypothetical protein
MMCCEMNHVFGDRARRTEEARKGGEPKGATAPTWMLERGMFRPEVAAPVHSDTAMSPQAARKRANRHFSIQNSTAKLSPRPQGHNLRQPFLSRKQNSKIQEQPDQASSFLVMSNIFQPSLSASARGALAKVVLIK